MKILVRLPNWLGDVVMSTAFIAAVKQLYPAATVDIVIKAELSDVVALIPGLRAVHPFSKQENKGLVTVYRFGKSLRAEKYDLFFNLPTSLSSAVLGWATRAKNRIGFGKEGGYFMLTHSFKKPMNVHRVDEYISLLEQFTGKPINGREVQLATNRSIEPIKNRVLINFNSEAESRRMPVTKAKAIIKLLTNTFTDITFSFIGSAKEAVFVDQLIESAENSARIENLAGKTNLGGLCNLMAASKALLTTDSGPGHLANSIGVPTVVLFGAGNELNTAPYNKSNLDILRYGQLSCEPCIKNTCKLYGVPRCMELLDELQIINALSVYLPNA
jgi:lipopolysaccharide heptosyltransferase II